MASPASPAQKRQRIIASALKNRQKEVSILNQRNKTNPPIPF